MGSVAPKYRFEIKAINSAGVVDESRRVRPVWGDGLTREYTKESGEQFYRTNLNGSLTFVGPDYDWIMQKGISTTFHLYIKISYDFGSTWGDYHVAVFVLTDGTIDLDHKSITIGTFTTYDGYTEILRGIDNEYNLLDLTPSLAEISIDKRPLIQIYIPGSHVVGCVLNSMYWEESCEPELDPTVLTNTYKFILAKSEIIINFTGAITAATVGATGSGNFQVNVYWEDSDPNDAHWECFVHRNSDGAEWLGIDDSAPQSQEPDEFDLEPENATAVAIGSIKYIKSIQNVYARFLCAVSYWPGVGNTYPLPQEDIVESNKNYRYVIGYGNSSSIILSSNLSTTPTKYGLYQPGIYYDAPNPYDVFLPVARNSWTGISIWFSVGDLDWLVERNGRSPWKFREAIPIWAAIKVLLAQIAPGITHEGTPAYSQFLYDTNPILGTKLKLFITQKSNILNSGFDEPASRAPVTLRNILDMLRDVYRCYWFVDNNGRFRIEHIEFFRNGGSYSGTPVVGTNLNTLLESRTGKPYSFDTSKWKYNKSEMTGRIEFGWMDEVTTPFIGNPINILSTYVDKTRVEKISVQNFTSDIDYMLLSPEDISKDGFALLATSPAPDESVDFTESNVIAGSQISSIGSIVSGYPDYAVVGIHTRIPIYSGGLRIVSNGPNFGLGYINYYNSDGALLVTKAWSEVATRVSPYLSDGFDLAYVEGAASVRITVRGVATGTLATLAVYAIEDKLPYLSWNGGYLQNGFLAFAYLFECYMYDLSGWEAEVGGDSSVEVHGVKRLREQEVEFPVLQDIDPMKLIQTGLGGGEVGKLSINLTSRLCKADLRYDITEQ